MTIASDVVAQHPGWRVDLRYDGDNAVCRGAQCNAVLAEAASGTMHEGYAQHLAEMVERATREQMYKAIADLAKTAAPEEAETYSRALSTATLIAGSYSQILAGLRSLTTGDQVRGESAWWTKSTDAIWVNNDTGQALPSTQLAYLFAPPVEVRRK